jgi:hypothetical protein
VESVMSAHFTFSTARWRHKGISSPDIGTQQVPSQIGQLESCVRQSKPCRYGGDTFPRNGKVREPVAIVGNATIGANLAPTILN